MGVVDLQLHVELQRITSTFNGSPGMGHNDENCPDNAGIGQR